MPTEEETAVAAAEGLEGVAAAAEADPKSFSPEYVRDLRQEAARYRVEAQQYKSAWEGVPESDQEIWKRAIKLTNEDPAAGAAYLEELALGLKPVPIQQGTTAPTLTEKDIDRMVSDRLAKAGQDQLVREIEREAEGLGYKPGTREYVELLWTAEHETDADLKAADAKLKKAQTDWFEAELEKRRGESGGWPSAVRRGSPPGQAPKEIKTFADATNALKAHLDRLG